MLHDHTQHPLGAQLVDVVVPTAGRPSLRRLLDALAAGNAPPPREVILVFDRDAPADVVGVAGSGPLAGRVRSLRSEGSGPAAARNAGWRAATAQWVAFLDDDVVPPPDWSSRLSRDLEGLRDDVAGSQGRVRVPLPRGRRPTDWERNVAGLETAVWATADMCYRRAVLARLGGFDERFPRAYREDADLGLRATKAGGIIVRGERWVTHPVGPSGFWTSVALQAGNQDDVLMSALHGPGWEAAASAPLGRRPLHLVTTAAGAVGAVALAAGRRGLALAGAAAFAAAVADLAWRRIAPGPRDRREVTRMIVTSLCLPPAATAHHLIGRARLPRLLSLPGPASEAEAGVVLQEAAAR
jgi:hypothetical protein